MKIKGGTADLDARPEYSFWQLALGKVEVYIPQPPAMNELLQ